MNRQQTAVIIVAVLNLLLIGLFPPYDYFPPSRTGVGAFDGFSFFFADHPNRAINAGFLQLELGVVAMNAAIAWLLASRKKKVTPKVAGKRDWQAIVLVVTEIGRAHV